MLTQVISLGLRIGAVGGLSYYTIEKGVWSPSTYDGADALTGFKRSVIPITSDYFNQLPKSAELRESLKLSWNNGIEKSANTIASVPTKLSDSAKKCMNYISDVIFPES